MLKRILNKIRRKPEDDWPYLAEYQDLVVSDYSDPNPKQRDKPQDKMRKPARNK